MTDILGPANNIIWYITFLVLIPLGIYFTIKLKCVQARGMKDAVGIAAGSDKTNMKTRKISAFESFLMGLGARIGVGNIAGVAAAITLGGPGAIFWMWVFAIIISVLGFAEATLSQIYKEKKDNGQYVGGPPFYIKKALGENKFSLIMAALLIITYGVGLMVVNSSVFMDQIYSITSDTMTFTVLAILFTILIAAIIIGGIKRVAIVCTFLIPAMIIAWIGICAITLAVNWQNIGNAFAMIFRYAFSVPDGVAVHGFLSIEGIWEGFKGPIGGLLGTVIALGLRKCVFSNESGVGSCSVLSGSAEAEHPVKVGLLQTMGILIDTLVICTLSAITILSFGSFESILSLGKSDAPLVCEILSRAFLGNAASIVLSSILVVCVISSVISFYGIVETTSSAISKDGRFLVFLKIVIIASILVGCFIEVGNAYAITEILMAACAIPHMVVLFRLRGNVLAAYRDYRNQRKAGVKTPKFSRESLPDKEGVTEWE